jgi:hypothetical protein
MVMNKSFSKPLKYVAIAAFAAFLVSGGSKFNSFEALASSSALRKCTDFANKDCTQGDAATSCESDNKNTRCQVCIDPDGDGKFKWETLLDVGQCSGQQARAFINAEKGIGLIDLATGKEKVFKKPTTIRKPLLGLYPNNSNLVLYPNNTTNRAPNNSTTRAVSK